MLVWLIFWASALGEKVHNLEGEIIQVWEHDLNYDEDNDMLRKIIYHDKNMIEKIKVKKEQDYEILKT